MSERYLKLLSLQARAKHGNSPQGRMHVEATSFGFPFLSGSFLIFLIDQTMQLPKATGLIVSLC